MGANGPSHEHCHRTRMFENRTEGKQLGYEPFLAEAHQE